MTHRHPKELWEIPTEYLDLRHDGVGGLNVIKTQWAEHQHFVGRR